jgi:hypothetical protein
MQFPVMLGSSGDEPNEVDTKGTKSLKYITSNKTKEETKCYCRAGTDDDDDGLTAPNPRGCGQRCRPPSHTLG